MKPVGRLCVALLILLALSGEGPGAERAGLQDLVVAQARVQRDTQGRARVDSVSEAEASGGREGGRLKTEREEPRDSVSPRGAERSDRRDARKRDTSDEKIWRSEVLNLLAVGMGIGDVTGSGQNEVVLIDPNTVYLYRLDAGKMNLLAEFQVRTLEFKSVDVAKIRKQGPCRIYVSAQNRGSVSSLVLEYRNGALLPVVQNLPYFLRVITYPTKGPILLGQKRGMTRIYDGPIFALDDKGDDLEARVRFGVPLKIPIFGFAIGDLEGNRKPLIAVYDREEHLRVYDPGGKRLYVSQDYYGGSDVLLRTEGTESKSVRGIASEGDEDKEFFRPRIMALDLSGDGRSEVLAITHSSKTRRLLSRTKMLEEGQVIGLIWNGDALEESWRSPKVAGMISDFAVDTLPGFNGKRLITFERKKTDWLSFLRSESQVRVYDVRALMATGSRGEKSD